MSEPQHVSVDYSSFDSVARSLPAVPIRGEDEDIRIRIDISIEGQPDHFSQIEFLSAISHFGIECGANVSIDRCDVVTSAHESLDPDCLAVGGEEVLRRYVDGEKYVAVGKQAPAHEVDYDSDGEELPQLVDQNVHIPSYAEVHGLKNQQGYSFSNGNYIPALYAPCASTVAREEEDGRILNMLDKKFVENGCYLDENEQLLLAEEEFRENSLDNSMDEYPALPSSCWSGLRRYSANNTYSKREMKNQLDRIQLLVEDLPIVNEPQYFGDGTNQEEGMEAGGAPPAGGNDGQQAMARPERICGLRLSGGAC